METATFRALFRGNHGKMTRIFASLLFIAATCTATFAINSSTVYAAMNCGWISDQSIRCTDDNNVTTTFRDSEPNDTNRTFKSTTPVTWCKTPMVDTITLGSSPSSATFYDMTTPEPIVGDVGDVVDPSEIPKVDCAFKTSTVSLSGIASAINPSVDCESKPGSAQAACFEDLRDGNAAFAKGCSGPYPSTTGICANTTTPPDDGNPANDENPNQNADGKEPDPCDSLGNDFSLRWVTCPLLTAGTAFADSIDDMIESQLHYDTRMFDRSTDEGKSFYAVWSAFRSIALALILIIGLIMVVSQGSGMQFVDAYTIRKVLPRLLVAVVAITLSWQVMGFVITAVNDLGHWIQDIILMPFQSAAGSSGSDGTSAGGIGVIIAASFLGAGATFLAMGPIGILSLLGTLVLALLVGWLVVMARTVIITTCAIIAPIGIALLILEGTKTAGNFWKNAFQTGLLIFPVIMMILGIGKALSLITESGPGKLIFLAGGYIALPFAFKLVGGLMATIFSIANDRGRGGFDRMRNIRQSQMKQRSERWQDGSLYRDNRFMRPINSLGRRVGAAKAGAGGSAFMFGSRGRQALALYDNQIADKALKRNELLQSVQNDDDANGVLGMSGGTIAGARQAAVDLFGDGEASRERRDRAVSVAQAVGINRGNALAAARTAMSNKARAFSEGNVRALDRGVRRLARSDDEYNSLGQSLAFFARDKGRADLGGTEWIDAGRARRERASGVETSNAEWQNVADQNMLDGIQRTGISALLAGHTNQTRQYMATLTRGLQSTNPNVRLRSAISLKEVQGSMPAATGSNQEVINTYLFGNGSDSLRLDPTRNIAEQIAQRANYTDSRGTTLSGTALTTMGRTYAEYGGETPGSPAAAAQEAARRQQGG